MMKKTRLLRKLIRACVDDERTLQHERHFVDTGRGTTLARLARERQQFVVDLAKLVGAGQSGPGSSWGELLREVARDVQVAAAGANSGDAIASCRRSRARTEESYDRAMSRWWPAEMRRVLEAQQARLHVAAGELGRLQF